MESCWTTCCRRHPPAEEGEGNPELPPGIPRSIAEKLPRRLTDGDPESGVPGAEFRRPPPPPPPPQRLQSARRSCGKLFLG